MISVILSCNRINRSSVLGFVVIHVGAWHVHVEVRLFSLLKYAEPKFPQANGPMLLSTSDLVRANRQARHSKAANGKTLQESGRQEFKQGSQNTHISDLE